MNENIVLVTGMSGAGKSSAMNALEDLGYYCIDLVIRILRLRSVPLTMFIL